LSDDDWAGADDEYGLKISSLGQRGVLSMESVPIYLDCQRKAKSFPQRSSSQWQRSANKRSCYDREEGKSVGIAKEAKPCGLASW
jgi:hypothetical protein